MSARLSSHGHPELGLMGTPGARISIITSQLPALRTSHAHAAEKRSKDDDILESPASWHAPAAPPRLELRSHSQHRKDLESPASTLGSAGRPPPLPPPPSPRNVHGWRWFCLSLAIFLSAFTYGLDTTIAADVQGAVAESFGSVDQIAWLGAGFLVGSVTMILFFGKLFATFNMKWSFIISIVIFEVGSVVCGAAPSMDALIVGRVVAGIGGAGIYVGSLSIFTAMTTELERGLYMSSMGVCWGTGAIVGPLIGGGFSDSAATWRWSFYINLVFAALCAPFYLWFLPSISHGSNRSFRLRLADFDWLGIGLWIVVWVLFIVLFTFGGVTWSWSDGRTITCFVLLGDLLLVLIGQQAFAIWTDAENRTFPVDMLRSLSQILFFVGMSATNAGLYLLIYYIPIFFQFAHGDNAMGAAIRLLPFLCVGLACNFVCGYFLPRMRYYAPIYLWSGLFMIAGGAPLYTITADTPVAAIYGYSVLVAIGIGPTLQSGYTLAVLKLIVEGKPQQVPGAIGLMNVGQIGAGAISLVMAGQIFQNFAFRNLSIALAGNGLSAKDIRSIVAGTQSQQFSQLNPMLAAEAVNAIIQAMSYVWLLVLVAGAVNVLVSLRMKWERLF